VRPNIDLFQSRESIGGGGWKNCEKQLDFECEHERLRGASKLEK